MAIGLTILLMIGNLVYSALRGKVAERNPWRSRSPEWQIPSPIPEVSYAQPLMVVGEPYDYGLPDTSYVRMQAAAAGE
jgi:cytochrome c oxidase subunit 1